jgi:hypothetical protein
MKKHFIIIIFFCLGSSVFAQEKPATVDIRFGVGMVRMQDIRLYRFENELTKKWNRFLSSSLSLNFAVGGGETIKSLTALNGDINVFVSPFGNQKKHNFKLGTGISYMYIQETESYYRGELFPLLRPGEPIEVLTDNIRRGVELNFIIDYEISIGKRYLIGTRAIMQPQREYRDPRTTIYAFIGGHIKFGMKL